MPSLEALDFADYDTLIDHIAQDLHDGKIKPSDLNQELIMKTYNDLADGASQGVGKAWTTQYKKSGEDGLVTELKKNLYSFASAKNYAQLETLNKMLYYQDGTMRPFNEYSQLAKGINRQYNKNWLQAEHQTAITAGQMAMKWKRIQRDKDLFPNLKYRTVGDERVREEHAVLNGTIRPVGDSFWSTHYPPNGWRCRCDVVQTAEPANDNNVELQPNPDFVGNVATDEVIFSKNNKFFKLLKTNENAVKNAELLKLNAPLEIAYTKNGKSVKVNIFHDKKDIDANLESAKIIVDQLKLNVEIRAHLNVDGFKNPEFYINKNLMDLKSDFKDNNYKSINNAFKTAKEQGGTGIVFNFTNSFKTLNITEVNRWILSNINEKRGKFYSEIIFIYKSKSILVSRETIVKKELLAELQKLKANS